MHSKLLFFYKKNNIIEEMIRDNKKQIIFKKQNIEKEIENIITLNSTLESDLYLDITKEYSKDESFLNKLSRLEFEIVPNQLFVDNFISLQNVYNSLLLYYGNNQNVKITIIKDICDNFLIKEKKIIFISSTKEIQTMKSFLSNNRIDLHCKFYNYSEFQLYAENCITGNSIDIQKRNIQYYFNDCLLIIDQIENLYLKDNVKIKEHLLTQIIEYTSNLRLLLSSSKPIYNNIKDMVWIINLLKLNDKKKMIHVKDIFDEEDEFILPSLSLKRECGKSYLKQNILPYLYYVKQENPFLIPFHIYPSSSINNSMPEKHIDGKNIQYNFQFLQLYLSKIKDYQKLHYLIHMDRIKKKMSKIDLHSLKRYDDIYNILQGPLQLLNMTYISNTIEKDDDSSEYLLDHIGSIGFLNNVSYIKSDDNLYQNKYEVENFKKHEIGNYSSKIAEIGQLIEKCQGTIMIYSRFIHSGLLPMSLALEERGYLRFNSSSSSSTSSSSSFTYIMITGDKTFSPNIEKEIDIFNNVDNYDGKKIKIILISESGFYCMRRYNNIRQLHFMEPGYTFNEKDKVINSIDSYLPITKRNIEIYFHACLNKEEECVDLYLYRMMDAKMNKINTLYKFLMDISIECLLQIKNPMNSISINELSKFITNKYISMEISDNKLLKYEINENIFLKDGNKIKKRKTTKERQKGGKKIEDILRQLFKENNIYYRDTLIELINRHQQYPLEEIYSILKLFTNKEDIIFLVDQYDRDGYIKQENDYYLFHPIENRIQITKNMASVPFQKKERILLFHDIIDYFEKKLIIIFRKKRIIKDYKISFSIQSRDIIEIMMNDYQITNNNLRQHFIFHYIDKLSLEGKLVLLEELYTKEKKESLYERNDQFQNQDNNNNNINIYEIIFLYFDRLIFVKNDQLFIVLSDNNDTNCLYNLFDWSRIDIKKEDELFLNIPIKKMNKLYVGYYGYMKKDNERIFKIKDMMNNEMSIFDVEKIGIQKVFVILNSLQNQLCIQNDDSIYQEKLTKFHLVILIEMLLREMNMKQKSISFITPEQSNVFL